MKYINELHEGENIIEHYLCKSRQTMKSRNGKNYLSLKLQDKTGMVDAKVWDLNNDIQSFQENDFIKVDAFVTTFNNELQLNVKRIRRSREGEYDPADFVPSTDKNIDEMYDQLMGYIKTMKNPYLKKLLEEIFLRHPAISKEFKYHSAAKAMHHSFRGGLVEHTLSVTQLCDFLAPRYNYVNRDILVASAMLHDVGKVLELSDFPTNDYTDDGQLLGHLILGSELIRDAAAKIDGFPKRLESLMKHCMLSHHGEYEYGSPKLPSTPEAFLLHCADNLDAKTKMIEEALAADSTQGHWAGYNRMLQRNLSRSDFE
ncbi:3'-5' exoribonuclease YhaM family protein [Anaerotignum lactatifermentans]|uniref:3'-5' exoribonuclease YhaM family protein n=1 Tax=Anaerotignum lactatifermentans TaxID=160404 RepID=UPI00248F0DD3|nr:3'-5' exoribonuclease YhaM family protein [Anaerotignum lactatifermentans]